MRTVVLRFVSIAAVLTVMAWFPGVARGEIDRDNVLQVRNPLEAPSARTLTLEKLWKIGGYSESDEELFGVIVDLATDVKGRVYLLDMQLAEVKVFAPDGGYLRTIGREGDGPGEFRSPTGLLIMPNGNLCVVQPSPARMSLFSPDGEYVGEFELPAPIAEGVHRVAKVRFRGGVFVFQRVTTRMGQGFMENVTRVLSFKIGDTATAEIAQFAMRFDFAKMTIREKDANPFRWTLGPSGRVYVNHGLDYTIEAWQPDGSIDRIITRKYKHRRRTEQEIDEVRDYFRRGGGTRGVTIDVMKYDRDILWLGVAKGDRIWVLSSHGSDAQPEDTLGTFDVYDAEGRLSEEIRVKGEGDPRKDRYYLIGDRFYVVTQYAEAFRSWQAGVGSAASARHEKPEDDEEPEPMGVICYSLPDKALR